MGSDDIEASTVTCIKEFTIGNEVGVGCPAGITGNIVDGRIHMSRATSSK